MSLPTENPNPSAINVRFNHVGVSVPDCEAAVKWYTSTMGLKEIRPQILLRREDYPDQAVFQIYGPDLNSVKIAFLGTNNQVGLEIFEFVDPPSQGPTVNFNKDFWTRGGFFHIALTVPDPANFAKLVEERGGKQIGPVNTLQNGEVALYAKDPWGNILELVSAGDFVKLVT